MTTSTLASQVSILDMSHFTFVAHSMDTPVQNYERFEDGLPTTMEGLTMDPCAVAFTLHSQLTSFYASSFEYRGAEGVAGKILDAIHDGIESLEFDIEGHDELMEADSINPVCSTGMLERIRSLIETIAGAMPDGASCDAFTRCLAHVTCAANYVELSDSWVVS